MGMNCRYPLGDGSVQGAHTDLALPTPAVVSSTHDDVATDSPFGDLKIIIGTSQMMHEDSTLVRRISRFSDKGEHDVRSRLSYGDAGSERANRVMHVAFLNGVAVGWCSSSTS